MRHFLAFLVAALALTIGADSHARPTRTDRAVAKAKKGTKKVKRRRARMPPRPSSPLSAQHDELALSPVLIKQLQRNLVDGGYLRGTTDGRLSRRTRRALAEFQREYHMTGTGSLDRPTAEALLGRDAIGSYAVAGR
jgi:hypothetical protein